MFVKICGITSEEDALLAVAMGADAVGFVFAPSSRQIAASKVADIAKRLPAEIVTVGVFRNETQQRVVDIVHQTGLRAAQLHGHESPATSRWIGARIPLLIKAFTAGDPALDLVDDHGADAVLLDSASPGSGEVFDWSLADVAPANGRVILAGGLTPDNVADAVRQVHPWGVDVATGVESAPGRKDARKVRAFVQAARRAEGEAERPPGALRPADPRRAPAAATPSTAPGAEAGSGTGAASGPGSATERPFDWMADDPS